MAPCEQAVWQQWEGKPCFQQEITSSKRWDKKKKKKKSNDFRVVYKHTRMDLMSINFEFQVKYTSVFPGFKGAAAD